MVKNLRYLLLSMVAMLAGTTMAQTEFDFDTNGTTLLGLPGESSSDSQDGDITEAKTATIGDYSVTVSAGVPDDKGNVKTPNRLWNKAPKLRMYTGTLTITSSGANFKSIVFTSAASASQAKWGANNSASVGTINTTDKKNIVWSGDAKEVVFTITANTQISTIVISTEAGEEPTPQPEPEVKKATVAEALSIIDALENGAKTDDDYLVKGYVVAVTEISAQYGNATFTIADEKDGTEVLTIFRAKGFNGENITDENLLKAGDLVEVQGKLQKYVKDEEVTPEMATGGKIVSINGKTEGGEEPTPQPEPEVKKATVAEALAIIDALENGAKTDDEYLVKGYVVTVTEISAQYGNATFTIADEKDGTEVLTIFRVKGFNGESITDENLLKAGDLVEVQGKLQKYVKNEEVTPEMATGGKIVSINNSTAIEAVMADKQGATVVYNLAGQRVMKAQKGLYIMNGKKYLVK